MAKARRGRGEGGLFENKTGRRKGTWTAYVTVGYNRGAKIKRYWRYARTKKEAQAKLRELQADLAAGKLKSDPSKTSLYDHLSFWLENVEWREGKGEIRIGTYRRYKGLIEKIKDSIGQIRLTDLRSDDLEACTPKNRETVRVTRKVTRPRPYVNFTTS